MMNIKLLAVVTPLFIYYGCSTRKTFWEEKFTGEEKFTLGECSAMNIKNCGCRNVRKHTATKGSYNYVTLDISFIFDSMENMIITSSESKVNLGISGKVLITSLGLKSKTRPKKYKNSRCDIGNVSKKDLSKIIREFGKLTCESNEKNRPKHQPADSYIYLAIQIGKCMMKSDDLNFHIYPLRP